MSDRSDDVFRALADGHRRRILSGLCGGPMVAGDLGRLVRLAPNAVSFHLKELRNAGLVSRRREGRHLRYYANRDALAEWRVQVGQLFPGGQGAEPPSSTQTPESAPDAGRGGPRARSRARGRSEEQPSSAVQPAPDGGTPSPRRDELAEPLPTELL